MMIETNYQGARTREGNVCSRVFRVCVCVCLTFLADTFERIDAEKLFR